MSKAHRLSIRPISSRDKLDVTALLVKHWGATAIISRGKKLDAACLPGFITETHNREICGLITLHVEQGECEVVSLDAFTRGQGIGSALMGAARSFAEERGLKRLWLITTNDNLDALGFYQKLGMRLVAVHRDAVEESRKIKPEIPLIAEN